MKRNLALLLSIVLGVTSLQLPAVAAEVAADDTSINAVNSDTVSNDVIDDVIVDSEEVDKEAAVGISGIEDPRVVSDSSMEAGQKVTYDCIWLGSYPQAEVVADKSTYTAIPSDVLKEGDLIEDASLYSKLQSATYNGSNETTINGTRYRRMKEGDTTCSSSSSSYYSWTDSTTYHYFKYEPIKWRVIEKNSDNLLLLADKAVDDKRYNETQTAVTWETCSLRTYLNGTFYDNAFNAAEKAMIKSTTVENADNLYYGTSGGNNTTDKVFLLSEKEVYKTIYDKSFSDSSAKRHGFADSTDTYDEARRSQASTYARARGTCWNTSSSYKGNVYWGMRSPGGCSPFYADHVLYDGRVDNYGGQVSNNVTGAVRPALKISLSSLTDSMYAGTVCSDGTVNETAKPGDGGGSSPTPTPTLIPTPTPEDDFYKTRNITLDYNSKFKGEKIPITIPWGLETFTKIDSNVHYFNKNYAKVGIILSNEAYSGPESVRKIFCDLGIDGAFDYTEAKSGTREEFLNPRTYFGHKKLERYNFWFIDVKGTNPLSYDALTDILDGAITFNESTQNTANALDKFMTKTKGESLTQIKKGRNIFFLTGHSLGGAIANDLSEYLYKNGYASIKDIYTFTYEAPGTVLLHDKLDSESNAYNMINSIDGIPDLPPYATRYGYQIGFSTLDFDDNKFKDLFGVSWKEKIALFNEHSLDHDMAVLLLDHPYTEFEYIHKKSSTWIYEKVNSIIDWTKDNISSLALILCPVDVQLYSGNTLICESVGDKAVNYDETIAEIQVIDNHKCIYIYNENNSLNYKFTGTDDGSMEYYIFSLDNGNLVQKDFYTEVNLYKDKKMISAIYDTEEKYADLHVVDDDGNKTYEIVADGTENPVEKYSISLKNENMNMIAGDTYTFYPTIKDQDGKNVYNIKPNWKSSNVDVVSVLNGKATALSAGTAIVTAEYEGASASCNITVKELPMEEGQSLKKIAGAYYVVYTESVSYNGLSHIEAGGKINKSKIGDVKISLYDSEGKLISPYNYKVQFKNNRDTYKKKYKQPYFTIKLNGKVDSYTKSSFKTTEMRFDINPMDISLTNAKPKGIKCDSNGKWKINGLCYYTSMGKKITLKPANAKGVGDYRIVEETEESLIIEGIQNYTGRLEVKK